MSISRLRAAFLSMALTAVAACADDKVTAPASHPFKGECTLTATLTNASTLVVAGTCQLDGFGLVAYASTQTLNNAASTFTSTTTFTLTNGDILRSTNVGATVGTATGLNISGTETVTGGTGQFMNATGASAFTGAVTFTSATTTAGKITYDGTVKY